MDADLEPLVTPTHKPNKVPFYLIVFISVVVLVIALTDITTLVVNLNILTTTTTYCKTPPPFVNPYDEELISLRKLPQIPKKILLTNCKFIDANIQQFNSILIGVDGKIEKVGSNIVPTADVEVFNAAGYVVTPGIVDAHSHLGVYTLPKLRAHRDGNEIGPTVPMIRAVDGLNPNDPAIQQLLQFGVTTSQVLPGSDNVIGGESTFIKLKGGSLKQMLIPGAPRGLKMACGENPKVFFGVERGQRPFTRSGLTRLMRLQFEAAAKLKQQQDEWDCLKSPMTPRPSELDLESLVGLLRGKNMVLNVHCYEVEDLEMMIRLSNEFGFKINMFHHASEAHLIPDVLAANNITVALFTDLWGYKAEAWQGSVNAAKILQKAKVPIVFKSDHPITHAKNLLWNVGKGAYYGLDPVTTFNSITRTPAAAMSLSHLIGELKEGLDADIVIWDRHPLVLGAQATRVYIDGQLKFSQTLPLKSTSMPARNDATMKGGCGTFAKYLVKNVKIYPVDSAVITGSIAVENGIITCIGTCPELGFEVITLDGGIVTPGFIESTNHIGLMEIDSEVSTFDGTSPSSTHDARFVHTHHGIRTQTIPIATAYRAGVTSAVSHRMGTTLVNGHSGAFSTHPSLRSASEASVKKDVCLLWNVGFEAKNPNNDVSSTISGQFSFLRQELIKYKNDSGSDPFALVMRGELPVCAKVNHKDDIGQLLDLKEEFGFKLILIGAAEAHLLADRIATLGVAVVITAFSEEKAPMQTWDLKRTTNTDTGASVLYQKGVKLAFGAGASVYDVRNLRWMAGLVSDIGYGGVPYDYALRAITKNVAEIFSLDGVGSITSGAKANFVLFDGDPLTFAGRVRMIAFGANVDCSVEQF